MSTTRLSQYSSTIPRAAVFHLPLPLSLSSFLSRQLPWSATSLACFLSPSASGGDTATGRSYGPFSPALDTTKLHLQPPHSIRPPQSNVISVFGHHELILGVLRHLDAFDLVNLARTCKTLHPHAYDDQIWQPLIAHELGSDRIGPSHFASFRELYAAHHPFWFLPRHRIWFSDKVHTGKLLICRYEPQSACIVAYPVTAVRGRADLQFWDQEEDVVIHSFNPQISLGLESPVVRLPPSEPNRRGPSRYAREISMDIPPEPRTNNTFMLCRSLPDAAIGSGTHVWAPLRFPADSRTRNASSDDFTSAGHHPTTLDEVSQHHFRVRRWMDFNGDLPRATSASQDLSLNFSASGRQELWARFNATIPRGINVRMPQEISTFATIPISCYTPTPEKPWQGIWCGDYSGHGCEFLLITQPNREDELPLPEGMRLMYELMKERPERRSTAHPIHALDTIEILRAYEGANGTLRCSIEDTNGDAGPSQQPDVDVLDAEGGVVPAGRLEAIKLTGDLNVPRGEYSFIAPDIGAGGLLRVAHEPVFQGARVVRSAGHIAGQNFTFDEYQPSQLIMLSHDQLAHYWEEMGHISYYLRVDVDALANFGQEDVEVSRAAGKQPFPRP